RVATMLASSTSAPASSVRYSCCKLISSPFGLHRCASKPVATRRGWVLGLRTGPATPLNGSLWLRVRTAKNLRRYLGPCKREHATPQGGGDAHRERRCRGRRTVRGP